MSRRDTREYFTYFGHLSFRLKGPFVRYILNWTWGQKSEQYNCVFGNGCQLLFCV